MLYLGISRMGSFPPFFECISLLFKDRRFSSSLAELKGTRFPPFFFPCNRLLASKLGYLSNVSPKQQSFLFSNKLDEMSGVQDVFSSECFGNLPSSFFSLPLVQSIEGQIGCGASGSLLVTTGRTSLSFLYFSFPFLLLLGGSLS